MRSSSPRTPPFTHHRNTLTSHKPMTLSTVLLDLTPPTGPLVRWRAEVVHQSGAVASSAVQARARAPIPGQDPPPEPGTLAADGNETRLTLAPTKSLQSPVPPEAAPAPGGGRAVVRQTGSVLLVTPEDRSPGEQRPDVLRASSSEHITESDKRLVLLERGPEAARSSQRFTPLGAAMLSADSQTQGASVWAAGSVQVDRERGTGRWVWQSGAFLPEVVQPTGQPGRWLVRLAPARGLARQQATILCTPRGVAEPGAMVLPTVLQLSPTDKSICLRAEAPDGELGAIAGFDVVVLMSQGRGDDPSASGGALSWRSLGAIRLVAQPAPAPAAPVLAYRSGGLLERVERPARGELIVELGPRAALSPEASALIASPYGSPPPGRMRCVAVEHLSPTRKRLTLLEENRPLPDESPSGGGEQSSSSVRADFDVDFAFFAHR